MSLRINLENSFIRDPLQNKKYDFLVDPLSDKIHDVLIEPLTEPERKSYELVHPYDLRAKARAIHEPSVDLTD